jgi:two-component system, response regulator
MMLHKAIEILFVEDNPDDIDLTLRAFRKAKLLNKVFVVRNGADALDFVFAAGAFASRNIKETPTLVLLDLILPKVHGLDVLRTLKSDPRTSHVPVVILANSREEKDIMQCYRIGAEHYLIKPFRFDEFLGVLSQLGLDWHLGNKSEVLIEA